MYTTWYYLSLIALQARAAPASLRAESQPPDAATPLQAASIAACSATTQWPQLKVARDWRFPAKPAAIAGLVLGSPDFQRR